MRGEEAFKAQGGRILHSSQYNDAGLAKGKKVVVLGGSKSATDIAVNAVNSGASEVTLVYREPVWRIPYFIGGLINFKRILYIRAQEEMFKSWGIGALSRFKHAVAKPFVWANWRGLESMLKLQLKLKKCDMVPEAAHRGRRQLLGADRHAGFLSDGGRWPDQGHSRQLRPL